MQAPASGPTGTPACTWAAAKRACTSRCGPTRMCTSSWRATKCPCAKANSGTSMPTRCTRWSTEARRRAPIWSSTARPTPGWCAASTRAHPVLDLRHAYYTLLGSAAQLALCRRAHSVAGLPAVLRRLWDTDGLGDAPLLQAIGALNHEDVPDEVAVGLAGLWLPHSYHVRSQRMLWCLPDGAPTEPFHDEYLSRCWRSATLNQLFSPRTSLKALAACAQRVPRAQPAGFIFHLSRCGSTLLSGCLSELDEAAVFSESPVLTEALVDPALTPLEKSAHDQSLIDLKAVLFPGRRVVVKWNAGDIFHARAGRHMSGDPSLAGVAPVFGVSAGGSVLEHRIGVLQRLMESMQALAVEPDFACIDYRQLRGDAVQQVAAMFGLRCDADGQRRIAQRMQRNAKLPEVRFQPDGARKAAVFDADQSRAIVQRLAPLHRALAPPAERAAPEPEVADAH